MPPLRYLLLAMSVWSVANGALQKILLIMRHGDRTTLYPSFPTELKSDFNNGKGNITKLGRMEGYELGMRVRNMYQTFLTNNTNEIRANSSDSPLVRITTGCAVTGMYTPDDNKTCMNGTGNDGWPVPVNSFAIDLVPRNCEQLREAELSNDTIEANDAYLRQYNVTLNDVANYTGYHHSINASILFNTYDNLVVEKMHNLTSKYGWVDPMWPDLQAAGYAAFYLKFTTKASQKFIGGTLLNEIVQRVQKDDNTTKVHLYGTGRDIIAPLLLLLGVNDRIIPPYTATLIVELHDNKTVRIMYMNSTAAPISLKIPHCDVYCSVDKFVNLTSPFVVTDPVQQCRVNKSNK